MIYYKEEKKKLVIPSGFVMIPIECDEAIEQAREQGYQEGFADGSSATCDTEEGTYSLTDDFDGEETVFPSEGKTGFNKIVIVDDGYGDKKYDEGYADGIAECSGGTCDIQPLKSVMPQFDNYPVDYQMDVYPDMGYDGLGRVSIDKRPLYEQGYQAGLADCSGTSCNLVTGSAPLCSYFDGDDTVTPPQGYDGFSSVRIVDNGYGQSKYDQGYADGLAQCSGSTDCSSAITEAYQSGYTAGLADCSGGTCPTETGLINLDSGWSGYESYQPLGSGYFDQVIITDDGYGQAKFDQGYELGLATCSASSGSCLIEDEQTVSLNNDWTGFTIVYPSQGYDGLGEVIVADLGYGQAKFDQGYSEGRSSGYTEGYNAAITANCGSAITEAYESGVTEGQGSIFSVKVRWLSPVTSWNLDNNYYPDLFIVDESGTSHQLNYVYQQSPTLVRYNTGMEDDTPQGWIMFAEFAGYLQDGAKYIQPYQVKFPMLNNNLWNNNIEGLSVEINGEVIHNWRQDNSGLDDWQFGSGAWKFTPLATVVSDTYYDATHKMVTFYIQGQVPNNN